MSGLRPRKGSSGTDGYRSSARRASASATEGALLDNSTIFRVRAELDFGETPFVSGNTQVMGNFDPENSIPLYTTPDTYPVWETDIVPVAMGHDLRYKYGVMVGGVFDRWEMISADRCTVPPPPRRVSSPGPGVKAEEVKEEEFIQIDNWGEEAPVSPASTAAARDSTSGIGAAIGAASGKSTAAPGTGGITTGVAMSDAPGDPVTPSGRDGPGEILFPTMKKQSKRTSIQFSDRRNDKDLGLSDGVIVVSYYLPVIVTRDDDGKWNVEWDHEALLSLKTQLRVTRIGTVRFKGGVPLESQDELTSILEQFNCVPIYIDPELHHAFFSTFCKQTLWPVFHNLLEIYGPVPTGQAAREAGNAFREGSRPEQDAWSAYTSVQRIFKKTIIEMYHDGDLIWIHGFHLLLLPTFLSRQLHMAKIGLFLHTPFPSSEIFRTLSKRDDLLRGMLSADQIGFHLYEYARHFLTCCRRILGLEWTHERNGINVHYGGRSVLITCIHAGMDQEVLHSVLQTQDVQRDINDLMRKTKDKTVFAGIDRMERLKGVPLKLLAFERFLEKNPTRAGNVVLYQISLAVRERGDDYSTTSAQVQALVNRINNKFGVNGEPVVIFDEVEETHLQLKHRLALLSVADVLLVTTVRDGLNRWPFEFVLAQAAMGGEGSEYLIKPPVPGVMVLSEFTSCTRVLQGALHINPWCIDEVAEALEDCMTMHPEERQKRLDMDLEYVTVNTTAAWCRQCLQDLKGVKKDSNHLKYVHHGFGLGQRVSAMDAGFHALDAGDVVKHFRNAATRRLILLDYGGTIYADQAADDNIQHYSVATGARTRVLPSKKVVGILQSLCKDPKNLVYVLSGKERQDLDAALGSVQGLGLAAEAGFFYRKAKIGKTNRASPTGTDPAGDGDGDAPPKSGLDSMLGSSAANKDDGWNMLLPDGDQSWKPISKALMELYMERTHGVYIQQNESAVVWQFRDADPDFAHLQSKELEDQLKTVLKSFAVDIIRGEDYLEVRPSGVSKGDYVEQILDELMDNPPDFCICIGDDASDEGCYPRVKRFAEQIDKSSTYFTATVGKKPSAADNYVNDIGDVIEMLESMTKVYEVSKRFVSANNLSDLQTTQGSVWGKGAPSGMAPLAEEEEAGNDRASFGQGSAGFGGGFNGGGFNSGGGAAPGMSKSMSMPAISSTAMKRSTSSITLTEYMNNITEEGQQQEEEGDDGLWF
mmetsp:Transcript_27530/g.64255  ORF Transcript_27530/g.64255 Transcript_27530/m.64255 type:complete len:1210 (+) Transcript_27530:256-3885(+)|eukprot:CAMPEP_0182575288 /NCGR_PEP_ID=MMETSP1324-20130603/29697_1 /TAXON_ID=236786 /ORGANISM="Florenciella sp., Strain RCC1587" /LENGTH=1209 /DNA_ID=CAMNT_0024790833 /DNA_START=195 /DNA_END=3824 /DNA_ORIENTATION=+